MRVAGIELEGGRRVWGDAGELRLNPFDRVLVQVADGEAQGRVFVAPEQLIAAPPVIEGAVISVLPPQVSEGDAVQLPGSEMPPLGSDVSTDAGRAIVAALDHAEKVVTVRFESGEERILPLATVR